MTENIGYKTDFLGHSFFNMNGNNTHISTNFLYVYTYFDYNMSMSVKSDLPRIDKLRQIMNGRQGLLLTSDLANFNIPRTYLSIMEQNGEIERVSRGVYRSAVTFIEDELFSFQSRYSSTIFSHETALYLHGLTDRTPLTYSISAPIWLPF